MWLRVEGFKDLLQIRWMGIHLSGSFSFSLDERLKAINSFLKSYNKEVFGNVTSKKELALNYVVFWDSKEGTRLLTMKERDARQLAREEFKKWVLLEKTFWRQKSREIRLKEGNTVIEILAFFTKWLMANG